MHSKQITGIMFVYIYILIYTALCWFLVYRQYAIETGMQHMLYNMNENIEEHKHWFIIVLKLMCNFSVMAK